MFGHCRSIFRRRHSEDQRSMNRAGRSTVRYRGRVTCMRHRISGTAQDSSRKYDRVCGRQCGRNDGKFKWSASQIQRGAATFICYGVCLPLVPSLRVSSLPEIAENDRGSSAGYIFLLFAQQQALRRIRWLPRNCKASASSTSTAQSDPVVIFAGCSKPHFRTVASPYSLF